MRAYGTAGGGVMFVPDEIDNTVNAKAQRPAAEGTIPERKMGLFARRRKAEEVMQRAA